MGGRSTRMLGRVHRTFASKSRGGTRVLAHGGFGDRMPCRSGQRGPFHFNGFAAVKRFCVRAKLDAIGVDSCGHVLSLSSTLTIMRFGGSSMTCRHSCFVSCPTGIVTVHFGTSQPNGRGLAFDCSPGPMSAKDVSTSNTGNLTCATRLSGGNVRCMIHVRTVTGNKALSGTGKGVAMGSTSRMMFLIATSASCGVGFSPSFGSPGTCIKMGPTRAAHR